MARKPFSAWRPGLTKTAVVDQMREQLEAPASPMTRFRTDGHPAGRTLHTLDWRLGSAAEREGFVVP